MTLLSTLTDLGWDLYRTSLERQQHLPYPLSLSANPTDALLSFNAHLSVLIHQITLPLLWEGKIHDCKKCTYYQQMLSNPEGAQTLCPTCGLDLKPVAKARREARDIQGGTPYDHAQ
jgi:hypothetical protein